MIPAVTRVEEWTRALMGVGADIALGSHPENGKVALLVIPKRIMNRRGSHKILSK
jgi:hypothetical protein